MNSLIIEPGLPIDSQKLIYLLQKIMLESRLEVAILELTDKAQLTHKLEKITLDKPDTIIALGSFAWFDTIISESCRLSHTSSGSIPIFAHISPPEKLAISWRITPYMERSLKRSVQAIAARKISEKKAFVCAQTIWFTHTLRLKSNDRSNAPSKFTARTPSGSELRIDAAVEQMSVSVHEDITSQNRHVVTIRAEKSHTLSKTNFQIKDANLLEKQLKSRTVQKSPEDVFHIQASQVDIHTPHHYSSVEFSKTLPEKFRIEPSKFSIKMITEKNDILKY